VVEDVNESLSKITKGAGIIFVGTALGMLLAFLSKVMLVRYITPSEYGIFSLGLVFFNIFVVVSRLGLHQGTPRFIAYYRGKEDNERLTAVAYSSIKIALFASILFALCLFFTSNFISTDFIRDQALATPLKIFAIAIPFLTLISIFNLIFQGFERATPSVYFSILQSVLFVALLGLVIVLSLSFLSIIYALVASMVFTFLAFAIYTFRKNPLPQSSPGGESFLSLFKGFWGMGGRHTNEDETRSVARELLFFSLPVLGSSILWRIMTWMDTLMLGYFVASDRVGLYNGAVPLAHLLPVVLGSFMFLYLPLASQFYARNQKEELKRIYQVLAKWIFIIALPVFLILLLFPEAVLGFIFGTAYIEAAGALQVLAIGYFILVCFGINTHTLTVMGRTRFVMWSTLIGVVPNIVLNILLIPRMGILGAAIATAFALLIREAINTVKLYSLAKIHPFTRNYLKPIAASFIAILIIYLLARYLLTPVPVWFLPVAFVLTLGIYFLSMLLTKSLDREDIAMLLTLEKRLGIDLAPLKKLLGRFL